MTIALAAVFVWPFIWMVAVLQADLPVIYRTLGEYFSNPTNRLPEFIGRMPLLGPAMQEFVDQLPQEPTALRAQLMEWATPWANEAAQILGDMGRNMAKFGLALLAVFFLYRDGEGLLGQTRLVLRRFLGKRGNAYLTAMAETSQAVMYGLILTALAQGFVAGIGYWVVGVPGAVLFGALTAILALIPFGPPIVWVPISLWLLWNGHVFAGIGLFIWGAVAISWIDNLVRPLVISSSTRIPFLLVILSVLGGVAAFGLLGLFLGPIAVALLLAVWREWVGERQLPMFADAGEPN
jgi:predicted PurR-regulated permease PerM